MRERFEIEGVDLQMWHPCKPGAMLLESFGLIARIHLAKSLWNVLVRSRQTLGLLANHLSAVT